MALFGKNKKEDKDKKPVKPEGVESTEETQETKETEGNWSASWQSGRNQILKSFYVSEKASFLNNMNQYVFKVFDNVNKAEVKTQVEKIFNVKVKDVKVLNMPKKRRDIGRHPGFKSGFKKAIVVLEEGYSIEQAKA